MFRIFPFLTLFMLSAIPSYSQNEFHFTEFWRLTKKGNSFYYRIGTLNEKTQFVGSIADHRSDGTKIQEGFYNEKGQKNGLFKTFHLDGSVYSKGLYENDKMVGEWTFYHLSGLINKVIMFDTNNFIINQWQNENGDKLIKDGTGIWDDETEFGHIHAEFSSGIRSGYWYLKSFYGDILADESYNKKGKLKDRDQSSFVSQLFEQYVPNQLIEKLDGHDVTIFEYPDVITLPNQVEMNDMTVFTMVNESPQPRTGSWEHQNFIYTNLEIPSEIEYSTGRVFIQLIIEKNGSISNAKVIKGIHPILDQEALRVVKLTSPWIPGYQRNSPRRVKIVEPVLFKKISSN